jgi:transposase
MSKNQKNNYSPEFRASSVRLALESDQSIAQTARDLGIKDNTLYNWVSNQSNSKENNNMAKNGECHFEEVARLRKELAMVKQERDLLKKAAAYFAKESR